MHLTPTKNLVDLWIETSPPVDNLQEQPIELLETPKAIRATA